MSRTWTRVTVACALLFAMADPAANACTNFLITKGASVDGSTMITYAADSHEFYGDLPVTAGGVHPAGAMRDIVEWDGGTFLGRIPQAPTTYWVVGNINEHQVAVGETTFGGRPELEGPAGLIDYGSLMFIALERSRTAREAIKVMTSLVAEHGYASSGESFSIADPNEAWILEMIGKGKDAKGAVWVAMKVPDGMISGHANQARIRRFPLDKPASCLYSPDVISFAREKGWFEGPDANFSFADVYAPADFGARRFCDSRVWAMFRRAAPSKDFGTAWVMGVDPNAEPLPLFIKPDKKISVHDVMSFMRDHFENTELDMTQDVGAGPFACPYRWRPMTWELDGKTYVHERATSTQQTGFSFVAQLRSQLPDPVGGVFWLGFDDTFSTVYTPMYCGIREAPKSFRPGVADLHTFSWDSAFWVFNWVSNWAYTRYSDMIVDIQKVQGELEGRFLGEQAEIDAAAVELFKRSPGLARDFLTRYSVEQGDMVTARWRTLGEKLLVKYMDGNVKDEKGGVNHPRYPDSWYRRIVEERGDVLLQPGPPPTH